ncbi:MAG TPA: DegT/DnrJ/EryC1/StrS family aminotransferase [Ignavibacteriaceae bacterium]|nr:DegT/DnrJ/EryC1/StrS family aminotransferase [Ignavibacteriaceae bacterium]
MKVPLLDLKPQYNSLKKELDEAILRTAESQYFILGPEVEKMEKNLSDYLKCGFSIGISSGTDALLIALMSIDIKPGDEVIVPVYSFFATAGVVSRLNAKPVFAEVDPVTFNIDPSDFEKKITSRTKAVIPVHLYGQSCDMDPIMEIARKHKIKVIEDAAQAIGVQYKDGRFVGTIGDVGCFSFFPSKNLGCFGDGGLVTTNNEELAYKLKILRVHGGESKYYHKIIGGNFRLDALQAAVINVKLPHLDSWSEGRRKNAGLYSKLFIEKGLSEDNGKISFDEKNKILLPKAVYKNSGVKNYHIYNQYIIRTENRNELKEFLSQNEIGNEIYYPLPFHLQECFKYLGYKKGDFQVSEDMANTALALPVYPELSSEQIDYVVQKIYDFVKK